MKKIILTSNRPKIVAILLILFYLPYLLANHTSTYHSRIPFILNEEEIPFMPWTAVIYLSLFIQGCVIIYSINRSMLLNVVNVMAILVLAHVAGFILFPTEYPREQYPTDNILIQYLRFIDTSANCLPSFHVGSTIFFAFCFHRGATKVSRISKICMWTWSITIIVSTLTTKQHYVLDICASLIVTGSILYLFRKKLQPYE